MTPTHIFGWLTPYMRRIFERDPAWATRCFNMSRADWHYVALMMALMHERLDDEDALFWLADRLFSEKRTRLLAEINADVPRRAFNLLPKMSGRIWRPAVYRRLCEMMTQHNCAAWLSHTKRISRRHVMALWRLPDSYRHPAVISRATSKRWRETLHELCFAIDCVRRIRKDMTLAQILKSLETKKKLSPERWVVDHYRQLNFPEAPWAGTDYLRPLITFDDLQRSALEFKNCIRTYLKAVLRGTSYFYRYEKNGKGVAIAEITLLPGIGWTLNDVLGPDNDEVKPGVLREVEKLFSQGGLMVAPQSIEPEYWLNVS